MLSFSSLALLAIAFFTPVQAAVLPKRRLPIFPPGLDDASSPLSFASVYGLDNQGGNSFAPLLEQSIPLTLDPSSDHKDPALLLRPFFPPALHSGSLTAQPPMLPTNFLVLDNSSPTQVSPSDIPHYFPPLADDSVPLTPVPSDLPITNFALNPSQNPAIPSSLSLPTSFPVDLKRSPAEEPSYFPSALPIHYYPPVVDDDVPPGPVPSALPVTGIISYFSY